MLPRRAIDRTRKVVIISLLCLLGFFYLQRHWLTSAEGSTQTDITAATEEKHLEIPALPAQVRERRRRIAIVTFVTYEKSYIHLSLKNKDHYARRHGLDFVVDYEEHTERGLMWHKFEMMERLIRTGDYEWVWWMDFDTLITNTDIKIDEVINQQMESLEDGQAPNDIDFILTNDCNNLNAGSFIARGHERSIEFFEAARVLHTEKNTQENQWSEQDCMVHLLKHNQDISSRAIRAPQFELNAFPTEIGCFDEEQKPWAPGAFVIHFAGAWAHVKGDDPTGQLMRKYEEHIIWGSWDEFADNLT